MSNGNAKTGKYQALRRRAEIIEDRLARIRLLDAGVDTHRIISLFHRREAEKLRAELSGLIRLGFSEGLPDKK